MDNINKTIYDIIILESQISNEIESNKKIILVNTLLTKIKILNNITEKYKNHIEEDIFNKCFHVFEYYCERQERTKQICNLCNMVIY